jgi:hypothetical protein
MQNGLSPQSSAKWLWKVWLSLELTARLPELIGLWQPMNARTLPLGLLGNPMRTFKKPGMNWMHSPLK